MIVITDADREAAASITALVEMRELIRAGRADHHAEPFARHRLAAVRELEAEVGRLKAAKAHIIKDARCAAEAHQQIRRDLEIDNAALRRELEEARGLIAAWVDWEESFAENHELHPFIGRARAALSDGG